MNKKIIAIVTILLVLVIGAIVVLATKVAFIAPDSEQNLSTPKEDNATLNENEHLNSSIGSEPSNTTFSPSDTNPSQNISTESIPMEELQNIAEQNVTSILSNPIKDDPEAMLQYFTDSVPAQYQDPSNIAVALIKNQSTSLLFSSRKCRDVQVTSCEQMANANGFRRYLMKLNAFAYNITPQEAGIFIPDQDICLDAEVVLDKFGKIVYLRVTQSSEYQNVQRVEG